MDSIDQILDEREKTHGSFKDHARIAQNLKAMMFAEPNYDELNKMQKEALEMIQHKVARILAGNPDEPDHWDDIAGYAKLPVKFAEVKNASATN